MFDPDDTDWVARFIGGPYDGAEVAIIAIADFVAVKRVRISGRRRLSVVGNPKPTPPGYVLYRLDGFDGETASYVYADLNLTPPADDAAPGKTRELEYA